MIFRKSFTYHNLIMELEKRIVNLMNWICTYHISTNTILGDVPLFS